MEIKVTEQELFDFILAQPDDKKINWSNTNMVDPCGCLFIQYAQHYFPGYFGIAGRASVGLSKRIFGDAGEQCETKVLFFPVLWNAFGIPNTYGELQTIVKRESATITLTGKELRERFILKLEDAGFNPYMFNEGQMTDDDTEELNLYECRALGMSEAEFDARIK